MEMRSVEEASNAMTLDGILFEVFGCLPESIRAGSLCVNYFLVFLLHLLCLRFEERWVSLSFSYPMRIVV